jgi:hypothetical protein
VSVLAVIMITIVSLLLNSLKARNRVDLTDVLEQNGSYILSQVGSDFLNSDGKNAVCGGNTLTLVSLKNGEQTLIQCNEGANIASNSASLTSGVTVSNCANFVNCDTDDNGNVVGINIGFTLSSGDLGSGTANFGSRSFLGKVAARN